MKILSCDYCDYESEGDSGAAVLEDMMVHYRKDHPGEIDQMSEVEKKMMRERSLMNVRDI